MQTVTKKGYLLVAAICAATALAMSGCTTSATKDAAAGDPALVDQQQAVFDEPSIPAAPLGLSGKQLDDVMVMQTTIDDWITTIVGTETSAPPTGFAGVWLDPEAATVSFAWKGDPPQQVKAGLDRPPPGVTMHLDTTATYSETELKSAALKLAGNQSLSQLKSQTGLNISTISLSLVGNGLIVTMGTDDAQPRSQALTQKAQSLVTQLAGGVATVSSSGGPVIPDQGDRWHATQPWRSGAALLTPTNSICSSGFGGTGSGGQPVFLTANHCGGNKGDAYWASNGWGARGAHFGTVFGQIPNNDTMLIGTTGESAGIVYDGAWNAPKDTKQNIAGLDGNRVGDLVCTSGAVSGVHCNLRTSGIGTMIRYAGSDTIYDPSQLGSPWKVTVVAAGSGVWTSGDSGGPVFALHGVGSENGSQSTLSGLQRA